MELSSHNIGCTIQGQVVLQNINLQLPAGVTTSLVGMSGAGKTTLLRCIAGLQTYTGTMQYGAQTLEMIPVWQRRFGYVEQQYNLFPHLSVFENIAYPLCVRKIKKSVIKVQVENLAEKFQIKNLLKRRPHELSGGEQQRVAFARAFVYEPQLLLLDEPFGALDALLRYDLITWLKQELQHRQLTTIFITHDLAEAEFMSQYGVVMDHGKIVAQSSWEELKQSSNPIIQGLLHKRLA